MQRSHGQRHRAFATSAKKGCWWLWAMTNLVIFKGLTSNPFSDLSLSPQTLAEQPHMIHYPQNSIYVQKTAYIALCLEPPARKMLSKLTFHMFTWRQKPRPLAFLKYKYMEEVSVAPCDITKGRSPELCLLAHKWSKQKKQSLNSTLFKSRLKGCTFCGVH